MTLNELKNCVDKLIEFGHGENEVLITLSDVSVGPRASVGIESIFNGFDWESGQVRIQPTRKIISYEKNRDKVIEPRKSDYEQCGKHYTILNCKKCGNKVHKNDMYCVVCGQRIKEKKN